MESFNAESREAILGDGSRHRLGRSCVARRCGSASEHSNAATAEHSGTSGGDGSWPPLGVSRRGVCRRLGRSGWLAVDRWSGLILAGLILALVDRCTELPSVAFRVSIGALTVAGRLAASVDLAVGVRAGLTARDDATVLSLGDHAAVADVRPVAAEIQLNVVCGPSVSGTDTNRVADRKSVGTGSECKAVAKVDAIFGF